MYLEEKIKNNIVLKKNHIRLDKFIKYALFDKDGYYYAKNPIGKNRDFITSPEISQVFGEIIGQYLYYFWKTKIKSQFNLIELGPGNGTLFYDIANSLEKYSDFFDNSKIFFIEINEKLIEKQKNKIKNLQLNNVSWGDKINFRHNIPSIIYSNEFFDCFPVRQFVNKDFWFEKYISINIDNNFCFKEKLITNKKLLSYLNKFNNYDILEISFERNNYFEKICKYIHKNGGLFFTIDYGYFKNIKNFTLQGIQNHKLSNILENVGNKDISSHVNFKDLITIAKKNRLKIDEFCTQKEFFTKFGILERKKYFKKKNNTKKFDDAIDRLIDENQMGNLFKCLVVSNL